jgi:hypothetical protein
MMRAAHCGMVPQALFSDTPEPPPVRTLRILTEWFAAEMQLGRLRAGDPQVAARALLGAVHNVVFLELVAPAASAPGDVGFQRALVDLILGGLAPEVPSAASARASSSRGQP